MFNDRDRRCTAVQPCSLPIQVMTARTIAGLPRITGTCSGWWIQSFWLWLWSLVWFQVWAKSCHLTSSKSAWKSTPKCTWMCRRVWWSAGAIRWPMADLGRGSRTQRRPTSPKRPRLDFRRNATTVYTSLTAPSSPTWTRWTTSFGHTSKTSSTLPPTIPKQAWLPPSAEYLPSSRRRLWKRYAPSSGSVSWRWLRLYCTWCNGYPRRIWTRRHEFKSSTWLIEFHIALIPLGKVWNQIFSLQLWVNSRAD